MNNILDCLVKSWNTGFDSGEKSEVLEWIAEKNRTLKVSITKNNLSESGFWYYDEATGEIRNKNGSFFRIRGLRQYRKDELVLEQPILIQDEIGYLGIICKEINGVLKFLMQAKIEPGNVNKIQISPTIQATKSNFTQKHGGKKPAYLDYFLNADKYEIIVDQIQSEQSSRFLGKRNRNIIVKVDEDIEVLPSHRWLTLGQIKGLLRIDNLVNMDTRTVLSCIPFSMYNLSEGEKAELSEQFSDKALFRSMFDDADHADFVRVCRYVNNYKMLHSCKNEILPLTELSSWDFTDSSITHKESYAFRVIFCDIEIEGREVTHWSQPLFEAVGMAVFGLISADFGGKRRFLVRAMPEAGCFDGIELAPTVQLEASVKESEYDEITLLFFELYKDKSRVRADVILSEEGGRFYCEENRNIILDVPADAVGKPPEGFFWLDYKTLNRMVQFNNTLNIQLRNLLSLLEI